MKQQVLIRLANESYHSTIINVDPYKFENVNVFPNEVFATIDGVRIAMLRDEYEIVMQQAAIQKDILDLDITE